ncbi:MAG: hypothetical protein M0P77_10830 [Firmicutes bacterium]|nr:hypothetical protein [Bacillota bacterium]
MLNLLINFQWPVFAIVLLLLHIWLGIPLILSLIVFGIWVIIGLIITFMVNWGGKVGSRPSPKLKNLNPYSVKNSDLFSKLKD